MNILSGTSDFFGLDIGTTALRVVQLKGSGSRANLVKYGATPLDAKIAMSDSAADTQKLSAVIRDCLREHKITSRNVAVGLPSNKVFTTVVDVDKLADAELKKNIGYQADSLIPSSLEDSKIDWGVIGVSPKDTNKLEIMLSSVAKSFVEKRLDMLEGIGLNVIAFEPDSLALTRSLVLPGDMKAQMILDMGVHSTDLVILAKGEPRLIRAISTGSDSIIKSAIQTLAIEDKQAEQFVYKFGLSKDKLEGQVYNAIMPTIDILVNDIEKSIKFFEARYQDTKIEQIIVTGGASAIPEFPLYLANRFTMNVEIGNAWRNVHYPQSNQNEIMSVSNHFGVAAGLAERKE